MVATGRALGLLFLFITSAAWIGASFITQALVAPGIDQTAPELEPWLLTLICSSTLMIYLPIGHYARKRKAATTVPAGVAADSSVEHAGASDAKLRKATHSHGSKESASGSSADLERQPLLHRHPQPRRGPHTVDLEDGADSSDDERRRGDASSSAVEHGTGEEICPWQIARAAMLVMPVWFGAQLAFTASLEFTSVTSNTVLSSCSSLFVYLGSLALGHEVGSSLRLASVVMAMAGTTLVALGDSRGAPEGRGGATGGGSVPLLGDALTLLAAALYAAYTIIMKHMLANVKSEDDGAVMALFLGCIGTACFTLLVPLVAFLALAGSNVVTRVTGESLDLALVQGLVDYVAADYAWARAVMLLGPTATSCGLAMQIPAAAIVDSLVNGNSLAWSETPANLCQFVMGSLLIIAGFIGVSLDARVLEAAFMRLKGEERSGLYTAWRKSNATPEAKASGDGESREKASRTAELLQQEPVDTPQAVPGDAQTGSVGNAVKEYFARLLAVVGLKPKKTDTTYIPLTAAAAPSTSDNIERTE